MLERMSMDSESYRTQICTGLRVALPVPFISVKTEDWQPQVGHCHENVDQWVRVSPGHTAVRGWVTVYTDGANKTFLTPHSVVRDEDGRLFDITPLGSESVRSTMLFVPHPGSEDEFFRLKDHFGLYLECETSR